MHQKIMFDRYYCIKNIWPLETVGENSSKSSFPCTYNGAESMLSVNILKCFTFATVHVTDDDVRFHDSPRMLIRKTTSLVLTACEHHC